MSVDSKRVLVVGKNSFLAREFAARERSLDLCCIGHEQAGDTAHYEGIGCVVNFSFAPALETSAYDAALDIDRRIARLAAARGLHYVMISSRRVYQQGIHWGSRESDAALGTDAYGASKLRVERELGELLGDGLTVLRPGNVIGYEPLEGRARFGAFLQSQLLRTGRIRLSVGPQTRRDIVTAAFLSRVLHASVTRRLPGIFNVGAGRAVEVGQVARWLIEGFGGGELVVENAAPGAEFLLDCGRLAQAYGLAAGQDELEQAMRSAGERIAAERRANG